MLVIWMCIRYLPFKICKPVAQKSINYVHSKYEFEYVLCKTMLVVYTRLLILSYTISSLLQPLHYNIYPLLQCNPEQDKFVQDRVKGYQVAGGPNGQHQDNLVLVKFTPSLTHLFHPYSQCTVVQLPQSFYGEGIKGYLHTTRLSKSLSNTQYLSIYFRYPYHFCHILTLFIIISTDYMLKHAQTRWSTLPATFFLFLPFYAALYSPICNA